MALSSSIQEKLTTIAENEQKVYDSGYSKGELDLWNTLTNNNTRRFYSDCFRHWKKEYFRPPFPIKVGSGVNYTSYMFARSNIKKFEKGYFDFSAFTPNIAASNNACIYYMFASCASLVEFEDIGLPAGGYGYTWTDCTALKTVEVMRSTVECTFVNTFKNCSKLVNIKFAGEIGNNFSLIDCPNVSYESLTAQGEEVTIMLNGVETTEVRKGLIHALYDYSAEGVTKTLTLNATAKARLTADDIKVITDKGWTLV